MSYKEGDFVEVEKDGATFEGYVIPGDEGYITLKMTGGGYIAGFLKDQVSVTVIPEKSRTLTSQTENFFGRNPVRHTEGLKNISVLTLSGPIGCYHDDEIDAEALKHTAEDMLAEVPEIGEFANISGRPLFTELSENIGPARWTEVAKAVYDEIKAGADGVIVTCGADTMGEIATAVSFMLETPVPVVFSGALRSPDRPCSDNHMNMLCAARAAVSDIAEVMIVMHATLSDDYCYAHRVVRCRKMNASKRNTFRSVSVSPIAEIEYKKDEIRITAPYTKRGEKQLALTPGLDDRCAVVKFFPGAKPDILDYFIGAGYKALILEGIGPGHVSGSWIPMLEKADREGIPVFVTSQCIGGRVNCSLDVTGRLMKKAGITECDDMITETAYVKAMWLMGQGIFGADLKKKMLENLRGELTTRHDEKSWF